MFPGDSIKVEEEDPGHSIKVEDTGDTVKAEDLECNLNGAVVSEENTDDADMDSLFGDYSDEKDDDMPRFDDDGGSDEDQAPKTLGQIAAAAGDEEDDEMPRFDDACSDEENQPPLCQLEPADALQCEVFPVVVSDAKTANAAYRAHLLQEWNATVKEWGDEQRLADVMSTMVKVCAECKMELAPANTMLPDGAVMCTDCLVPQNKILCRKCCMFVHRSEPLHRVQVWERGWRSTTLEALGLIYHVGHEGRACVWPVEPPTSMTVITLGGVQRVTMKFCGCGKYPTGPDAQWEQIRAVGWHESLYKQDRVCSTFSLLKLGDRLGPVAMDESDWSDDE
ncbi:hypothetical protein C8R46DRAFT_1213799 [Mycena filopes]|nr:hypothetical protein C8R46DRAFT_1213799 [Mycena filopes]